MKGFSKEITVGVKYRIERTLGLVTIVILLNSCMVGPKYTKPVAEIPPAYKEQAPEPSTGEWKKAQPSDQQSKGKWWEIYNDPQLNDHSAGDLGRRSFLSHEARR